MKSWFLILLTLKLYCDIKKMAVEANHTIVIIYGSPAAGSGNKRAALIGGLGRHLRPIFANWLYQCMPYAYFKSRSKSEIKNLNAKT
jgi:hypothetical protein